MLRTVSATMFAIVGGLVWLYVTFRIKNPIEHRYTDFGEILTFLFFVAGVVGVLVAVSIFVGPIM